MKAIYDFSKVQIEYIKAQQKRAEGRNRGRLPFMLAETDDGRPALVCYDGTALLCLSKYEFWIKPGHDDNQQPWKTRGLEVIPADAAPVHYTRTIESGGKEYRVYTAENGREWALAADLWKKINPPEDLEIKAHSSMVYFYTSSFGCRDCANIVIMCSRLPAGRINDGRSTP